MEQLWAKLVAEALTPAIQRIVREAVTWERERCTQVVRKAAGRWGTDPRVASVLDALADELWQTAAVETIREGE